MAEQAVGKAGLLKGSPVGSSVCRSGQIRSSLVGTEYAKEWIGGEWVCEEVGF